MQNRIVTAPKGLYNMTLAVLYAIKELIWNMYKDGILKATKNYHQTLKAVIWAILTY